MDRTKKILDAVGELDRSRTAAAGRERAVFDAWLSYKEKISSDLGAGERSLNEERAAEMRSMARPIVDLAGTPLANRMISELLSLLLRFERADPRSRAIMARLLDPRVFAEAETKGSLVLTVSPGPAYTKVGLFKGVLKIHEADLHLTTGAADRVDARTELILAWLSRIEIDPAKLDGIACRGGFFHPIPSGTYRVVPQMLQDLEHPRAVHASNLGVFIATSLARKAGRDLFMTTTDPVATDELDPIDRLTGFAGIRRDGTGAHYLNHKAVMRVMASLFGKRLDEVDGITAHLGMGSSIALHRRGRITSVVDAYSGIPSACRSGGLDLSRVLDGIRRKEINLKDIEAAVYSKGGLLSLTGTDDLRAIESFTSLGASADQRSKIELVLDFMARQAASAILRQLCDGAFVAGAALTGGLSRSDEIVRRIRAFLSDRLFILEVPGSLMSEALACGLLTGMHRPESLLDYVRERDAHAEVLKAHERLMSTVIFKRSLMYRKPNAPIHSLDELIDAACISVQKQYPPTVAILGADNEEALLAAKRANEKGTYRVARFLLLGDYTDISRLAYDFDLTIDNENYTIIDTADPVGEASSLLELGKIDILMKGSLKTEAVLRGVFQFLKRSGRLNKIDLISHVVAMEIPSRDKLLFISDAAVNPYPDEEKKIKILENALVVARGLNIGQPKVAVISAIENVNPSVESSMEAHRIAERYADRSDCIVEGPLSFDVAMDPEIAAEKGYKGRISGDADILIMPDIDAGNILYKTLTTQSGASCAGVILLGDLPMVLTSRGDTARSKLASISLSVKLFLGMKDKQ